MCYVSGIPIRFVPLIHPSRKKGLPLNKLIKRCVLLDELNWPA